MIDRPRQRHPHHNHPRCHELHHQSNHHYHNHDHLIDGNVSKPGTKVCIGSSAADVQQLLPGNNSFQLLDGDDDDFDDFDDGCQV